MRVAFDGTTLRPARTGVGCYAERLLRHLAEASPTDEFVVLSNRPADVRRPLPPNVEVYASRRAPVSLAWMQALAPGILREIRADVAHFTNGVIPLACPVPSVVTIHDMSLTLFPRYHPVRRVLLHRPLVDLSAPRASAIITHSNSAKRDIVRMYGLDEARVHAVHLAAAPEFTPVKDRQALDAVRRRHGLPERFILYVGTIEPRKNLGRLLTAFAARRRTGGVTHALVCAGPYGWRARDVARRVAALGLERAVHFLGYVPMADLPALYSLCDLFVFPSIYEGFGLPVVEAMACGAPVLAGRSGAVTEVAGSAAEFVDPLDTDAIGDALQSLGADEGRRRDLAARGFARVQEFSWERAAAETLGVYRTAAGLTRPAPADPAPGAGWPMAGREPIAAAVPVVLFGQAYYSRFDPKLWAAKQPYPPLGTLYAAAYLRQRGQRVALFDAMLAESEAEWSAALDRERPSIAVIYEDNFNYLSKMCLLRMRAAALVMIAAARARGLPVIAAGSDATDHSEVYLEAGATCVVIGEGEVTLEEAVRALGAGCGRLDDVRGLCFRSQDGRIVRTERRDPIRDLDALPLPAWDLVDVARYRAIWHAHHGHHSMNLVTTRGCPYHCNWCAKPIYGQRYAVRSAAQVVEEIAWLKRTYAPDHLWIADDIFGLRPGWVEEFARLLVARDAVVPFKCLMRADQVSAPVATSLRASGCRTVWIGAESGSQRILDAMEKGVRVEQIVAAANVLHGAGVDVGLFLQFGYPGEAREDIDQTLAMMRACEPDDIGVSISYPLPGTRFFDRVRAELGPKRNWFDSDDLDTMYHATYSPEFYRVLHQAVHAEFRVGRIWSRARLRPRHTGAALVSGLKLPLLHWQLDQLSRGPVTRLGSPLGSDLELTVGAGLRGRPSIQDLTPGAEER
jgi:anaerobic magnesium-protoporphyrin IX monomethyl ester cyclase